jgi:hypothetical protein
MTITAVIPRHSAELVRMTVVPVLSGAGRLTWIAAREWPLLGAVAALGVILLFGARLTPAELDPVLIGGYLGGLVVTRFAAREMRRFRVRLEVVAVSR